MMPTRNGARVAANGAQALCEPFDWAIERTLNERAPLQLYIPPRALALQEAEDTCRIS
jgi:hypothetical protein